MMKEREDESHKKDESEMEVGQEVHPHNNPLPQPSNANRDSTDSGILASNSSNIGSSSNISINSSISNENNDKVSSKAKRLSTRRGSAPSAIFFRSLSSSKPKSHPSLWSGTAVGKNGLDLISQYKQADGTLSRMFIMEGPVQFAAGVQIQDRYLFLFSDLLLVAKQRSRTAFKLKYKLNVSDMWIASCADEVSETPRPADRSFVLGWPTTNVVAIFPNVGMKDEWLANLSECITREQIKDEGRTLQLKVTQHCEPNASRTCQMTISNVTLAKDVVLACLKQMNLSEAEASGYQLWVSNGKEGTAYPLIGHETPFSIKLSQAREITRSRSSDDLENMTAADLDTLVENSSAEQKCEFHLRQKNVSRKDNFDDSTLPKSMKKSKKSPNIINTILRRIRPAKPLVFGLPLSEVCDEENNPPEEIIRLMVLVYQQGPYTAGILRKGNKAALGREIREKIDSGDKYTLDDSMAPTAASVFKEFLRCIPDGLLMSNLHEQWLTIKKDDPHQEKIDKTKTILGKLSPAHYHMLKLTICLLQHLAKHSSQNQMGPTNLATCIAPSFYTHGAGEPPQGKLKGDALKQVQMHNSVSEIQNIIVPLIAFMITNHLELFGEGILSMFVKHGCSVSPATNFDEDKYESQIQPSAEEDEEEDNNCDEDYDEFGGQHLKGQLRLQPRRQNVQRDSNSGTDSDSMHSVLSMQETGMGFQRDDSSIDSLGDRDYYTHESESSPKAVKAHLSPSNLSRDSGLTLSDNQLYDEEAYQADIANTMARMCHQGSSQFVGVDTDDSCYSHEESMFNRTSYPVAPPRRRSMKKSHGEKIENEKCGFTAYSPQKTPLKHSAVTAHLNSSPNIGKHQELGPLSAQYSLDKTISSSSVKEEEEATGDQRCATDFQSMESSSDIGTLVKSESGAHLYLSEETVPTEFSLRMLGNKSDEFYKRQPLMTDSSVAVSFQSQHSQSSCDDSAISDTFSRDGSMTSTPQTPDETQDKALDWVPDIKLPDKPWDEMFARKLNIQRSLPYSKSASDFLSKCGDDREESVKHTSEPGKRPKKSHEAEEVETISRPAFSITSRISDISMDPSFVPSLSASPLSKVQSSGQRFPAHSVCGSPPPSVLLQTFQLPAGKDLLPARANCDSTVSSKTRRSSLDSFEQRSFDPLKGMDCFRPEELMNVKSKPIIITPEDSSSVSTSSAASRAKLSKYMNPTMNLPLTSRDRDFVLPHSRRPEKPPNYQQALQRNFMIKYNVPIDITEKQKEDSARAKAMYEKSLQLYNEERQTKSSETKTASAKSKSYTGGPDLLHSDTSIQGEHFTSIHTGSEYQDLAQHGNSSQNSLWSNKASEKLDRTSDSFSMEPISHSLHVDVLPRHNIRPENDTTSVSRKISLSSDENKLPDSSSFSDNSVVVSTLSRDSGGQSSDMSSARSLTVSSGASRGSSSETRSIIPKSRSESYFRPVEPDVGKNNKPEEKIENEVAAEDDGVYVTLRKKPQQHFLKSQEIYEQTASSHEPAPSSSVNTHQQRPGGATSSLAQTSVPNPRAQEPSTKRGRSKESRSSLNLDVPFSNLHRSRSDSAEQVHKLGSYSPNSGKSGQDSQTEKKIGRSDSSAYAGCGDKAGQSSTLPLNITSEYQQSFQRAKSCFHQADGMKVMSSSIPSSNFVQYSSLSSSKESGVGKQSSVPVIKETAVEAILSSGSRSNLSSNGDNHSESSSAQESKKAFHWSVKDLKSVYDKSGSGSSNSSESTSQSSQSSHGHPPYQNPPPFRHHDSLHPSSTSSTSSGDSEGIPKGSSKTRASHRQGPQNYIYEPHGSYSSSEDSYSSSYDGKTTWSSNCSLDEEEISSYTNTTYI